MTKEQLLGEVEDLLRTTPTLPGKPDLNKLTEWMGRCAAVISAWDSSAGVFATHHITQTHGYMTSVVIHPLAEVPFRKLLTLLQQARFDLRMQTT